jgi:hypothetical protein
LSPEGKTSGLFLLGLCFLLSKYRPVTLLERITMKTDTASFTVWSPRGANITNKKLGQSVRDLLENVLPPGMAVEGYYSHRDGLFRMTDVTFSSMLKNEVRKVQPKGEEVQAIMDSPRNGSTTFLSKTSLNEEACQSHQDSGDLQEVRLVEEVSFYGPSMPCKSDVNLIQSLPPDDWSLEAIPIGQRVIVLSARNQHRVSIDLREVVYDTRRQALESLCRKMDCPQVRVVTASTVRFPDFIQDCKRAKNKDSVGVVAKKRSGNYVSGKRATEDTNWLYYLTKKDYGR